MNLKSKHEFSRRRMIYHAYQRKMVIQYFKALFSLLKNLPAAVTLFTSLILLQRKYRLNPWFLWLPYVKPQTRVFCEWVNEYSSWKLNILNLGCGVCSLEVALLNQGFKEIVSVDVQRLYLKVARELLEKYGELPLIRADVNLLPLRSEIFDIVALLDISYFASINLKVCFKEIFRILKPKGRFIADFYEGSKREDSKGYYLVSNLVRLARASSFRLMRFLPIYHAGSSLPYGYMIMARKEQ
jgi:SAM-dependent methyltransferase